MAASNQSEHNVNDYKDRSKRMFNSLLKPNWAVVISFQAYKPNNKNTGTACSFSVNPKDESIWSSLIKQSSWNEAKKIGSFSENQNNPNKIFYYYFLPYH